MADHPQQALRGLELQFGDPLLIIRPRQQQREGGIPTGLVGRRPRDHARRERQTATRTAAPLVPVAIWKLLGENTSSTAGELHGVKSEALVNSPHVGGVTSAACDPPLKTSLKSVNGNSGFSLNTVVNWPVLVFRCTSRAA